MVLLEKMNGSYGILMESIGISVMILSFFLAVRF